MKILFHSFGADNMGIEYMSALLKANGHKIDLIFDPGMQDQFFFKANFLKKLDYQERLVKKAKKFKPDLIAFSAVTFTYPYAKKMAEILKKELNVPTIIGGIQATCLPNYVIKESCFDMVCRGEGEYPILELCNSIEKGKIDTTIKNIWFKKNRKIIKNPIRPAIDNLDNLPFPDKSLFHKAGVFKKSLRMMAGRGCPHACSYCINNYRKKLYKVSYWRKHSVDYIINAIKHYQKKYKFKDIRFEDDIFAINEKWVEEFAKKYKKEINLPFNCITTSLNINDKIIKLLKYAGCHLIEMGVQSGSEKIRKTILKRWIGSNKDLIRAANLIKKNKIKLKTQIIFGIPEETKDDMATTVKLNKKLNPTYTGTFLLFPFPKLDISNYCVKKGYLTKENEEKIKKGIGSFHSELVIKHPFKEYAFKYAALTGASIKLPKFLEPLFWKLIKLKYGKIHKMIYLFSLPYIDFAEFWERLKGIPRVLYRAYKIEK